MLTVPFLSPHQEEQRALARSFATVLFCSAPDSHKVNLGAIAAGFARLTVTSESLYKGYMSDIVPNDTAHPEWRQLCRAALFEPNAPKLLERIARARNAILDRIEDGHSKE